jgi:hypothetical protein
MLTVMVCFDWSGNMSTRRPFASRYSVMPSTVVTRSGAAGAATGAGAAGGALGFLASHNGAASTPHSTINALRRMLDGMTGLPALISWCAIVAECPVNAR